MNQYWLMAQVEHPSVEGMVIRRHPVLDEYGERPVFAGLDAAIAFAEYTAGEMKKKNPGLMQLEVHIYESKLMYGKFHQMDKPVAVVDSEWGKFIDC